MEKLFSCPDCGNEVSLNAKVCPKCGNEKIKSQIKSHIWKNMEPRKKKNIYIIGAVVFAFIILSNIFGAGKPSACDCIDNWELGYFEGLSEENKVKRQRCNDTYAGEMTAHIECEKEKGTWKGK